jgi:hypothetical protein
MAAKHVHLRSVLSGTVALVLAVSVLPAAADMLIRDYSLATAPRYDRFGGGGGLFLGSGYDWSGIGKSPDNRWGTMISPSYFLTAYHWQPSTSLTFYEGNTLTNSHTYAIASLARVGSTDLCLGRLTTPLAAVDNITFYPILWGSSLDEYLGTITYNVGLPFRVGRNVVEGLGSGTDGSSTGFAMMYDYNNSDVPSVGGDETYLQDGDSGGPSFGVAGGLLGLSGIHWGNDRPARVWSYDSFVPTYAGTIAGMMTDPLYLLLIPEPGSVALLLGACLLAAKRPRRAGIAPV